MNDGKKIMQWGDEIKAVGLFCWFFLCYSGCLGDDWTALDMCPLIQTFRQGDQSISGRMSATHTDKVPEE